MVTSIQEWVKEAPLVIDVRWTVEQEDRVARARREIEERRLTVRPAPTLTLRPQFFFFKLCLRCQYPSTNASAGIFTGSEQVKCWYVPAFSLVFRNALQILNFTGVYANRLTLPINRCRFD